jgi:hypothetical protein
MSFITTIVGIGNTRILIDYGQKSPWTLLEGEAKIHTFQNVGSEMEFGKPM